MRDPEAIPETCGGYDEKPFSSRTVTLECGHEVRINSPREKVRCPICEPSKEKRTKPKRDPRKDPSAGDVIETSNERITVLNKSTEYCVDYVHVVRERLSDHYAFAFRYTLDKWRAGAPKAKVIHACGVR